MQKCVKCGEMKDVADFEGFRQCGKCQEASRRWSAENKEEYNAKRKQMRARQSRFCEECGRRVTHENSDVHFYFGTHPNSELYNLREELFSKLRELREQGNLTDEIREEMYTEYRKQQHELYKQLHKMFPDKITLRDPETAPTRTREHIEYLESLQPLDEIQKLIQSIPNKLLKDFVNIPLY